MANQDGISGCSRRIIEAILRDQLSNGCEPIDVDGLVAKEMIVYARKVARKVRNLEQYKLLFSDLEPDDFWLLSPSRIDTLLDIIFKYSQTADERVNRACVFLTFVADLCKDIEDAEVKESAINNSIHVTLRRLNSEDFNMFYQDLSPFSNITKWLTGITCTLTLIFFTFMWIRILK